MSNCSEKINVMPSTITNTVNCSTPTPIAELVADMEADRAKLKTELGEIRATMMVNFGPNGRTIKGLVSGEESIVTMIRLLYDYHNPNPVEKVEDKTE